MRDLAGIAELNGPRCAELRDQRAATIAAQKRPALTEPAWVYGATESARARGRAFDLGLLPERNFC